MMIVWLQLMHGMSMGDHERDADWGSLALLNRQIG